MAKKEINAGRKEAARRQLAQSVLERAMKHYEETVRPLVERRLPASEGADPVSNDPPLDDIDLAGLGALNFLETDRLLDEDGDPSADVQAILGEDYSEDLDPAAAGLSTEEALVRGIAYAVAAFVFLNGKKQAEG